MPTYLYECSVCGHEFEKFQKITDSPVKECPECGDLVKRIIGGGAGVIFKGKGFYQTDYKCEKKSPCGEQKQNCPCATEGK